MNGAIEELAAAIRDLAEALRGGRQAAPAAAPAEAPAGEPPKERRAPRPRKRPCEVCGKVFTDASATNLRRTCGAKACVNALRLASRRQMAAAKLTARETARQRDSGDRVDAIRRAHQRVMEAEAHGGMVPARRDPAERPDPMEI